MISVIFCVMVVVFGSAAAGRQVRDELDRIRRGERPAEDEEPARRRRDLAQPAYPDGAGVG